MLKPVPTFLWCYVCWALPINDYAENIAIIMVAGLLVMALLGGKYHAKRTV